MTDSKDRSLTLIALLMLIGSVAAVSDSQEGHAESASPTVLAPLILDNPLRVQFESKYVAESANWGQLLVKEAGLTTNDSAPDADVKAIKVLIQTYYRRWLDGDEKLMASLLDQNVTRIRGGMPTLNWD